MYRAVVIFIFVLIGIVVVISATGYWYSVLSQQLTQECQDCICYTEPCICNETFVCENNHNNNNIQAPHNEIEYYATDNAIIIKNVKDIGKLFGHSMQPSIFDGNTMIGVPYNNQKLKEGMIIRYKENDNYVIHRIKGEYQKWGYVITQGDNNNYEDNFVYLDQISDIIVGVIFT